MESKALTLEPCLNSSQELLLHNSNIPIARIPSEILALIFVLHQQQFLNEHARGTRPEFTLSHVSHAWRQCALDTVALWNILDWKVSASDPRIHMKASKAQEWEQRQYIVQFLGLYVERSKKAPIDIFIKKECFNDCDMCACSI